MPSRKKCKAIMPAGGIGSILPVPCQNRNNCVNSAKILVYGMSHIYIEKQMKSGGLSIKKISIKNGDIFMAALPIDNEGSLQSGKRPVLVVSNDLANRFSPVVTILPITGSTSKHKLPTHVDITADCGLKKKSLVLAEQIMSINKKSLGRRIGSIANTDYEPKVKRAMEIQLCL